MSCKSFLIFTVREPIVSDSRGHADTVKAVTIRLTDNLKKKQIGKSMRLYNAGLF